ncbi:hypothetical protein ACFOQM_23300 [Paenibacillus sp. GCM10012307]|uniref:Uncharacterized protein n=1 Tax=Paenibacillus roseus TaxID=2798579 RepID=A0A934MXG1_9BACL|nr:hypothetical protein [Paenibacillus roseus]MBJ6364152.1 hypothetical protein [Paenibacillus roseus]
MVTYQGPSNYEVDIGGKTVRFNWFGEYSTEDGIETTVLDELAPKWITRVSETENDTPEDIPEVSEEKSIEIEPGEAESKPEAKLPSRRKSSGK